MPQHSRASPEWHPLTALLAPDLSLGGASTGESVLYPCPGAVALEVNGVGDYPPVIRSAGKTYLLERNPAALAK